MTNTARPMSAALPPSVRRPLTMVAVPAAAVVVALGVLHSGDAGPSAFDQWVWPSTPIVQAPLLQLALMIDFAGEPPGAAVLLATLVAVCVATRRWRSAALAVAGPGLTVVVTTLAKSMVGRKIHEVHLSYPSGHTALLTALALVLALLVADVVGLGPLGGMLLVMLAAGLAGVVMAWSQTVLVAHYATDTIGGFCTALAVVPAAAWVIDRIADDLDRRRAGNGRVDAVARVAEQARSAAA